VQATVSFPGCKHMGGFWGAIEKPKECTDV